MRVNFEALEEYLQKQREEAERLIQERDDCDLDHMEQNRIWIQQQILILNHKLDRCDRACESTTNLFATILGSVGILFILLI